MRKFFEIEVEIKDDLRVGLSVTILNRVKKTE